MESVKPEHHTTFRHFAPHSAAFEGWYTKFYVPSTGASIVFVICTVPDAPNRPHMLSFTYISPDGKPTYQRELWVPRLDRQMALGQWSAQGTDLGNGVNGIMKGTAQGTVSYVVECSDYAFKAYTFDQVPWTKNDRSSTPAGWMVNLPLPVQWHVHSLSSSATLSLKVPEADIGIPEGTKAVAHQEKNWSNSFPTAHMWVQAHTAPGAPQDAGAHMCLAGGRVYSFLSAYIFMFRNDSIDFCCRPPVTLGLFGISPFLSTEIDWPARTFTVRARTLRTKIHILAKARKDTFFNISAPFSEGHRAKALAQSQDADIEVKIWRMQGWLAWLGIGEWKLVTTEAFRKAGLEFGGEYYGDFGKGDRSA